jgi:hypothetical protein
MGSRIARLIVLAAPAAVLGTVLACGTDAVGVESCRQIEQARCENAPACGIDLSTPVHRGSRPEDAVAACIRYYDDACMHGFAAPADPGAIQVQACIDAINTGDCSVVKAPESHPSCAFLVPPAPPPAPPAADAAPE